MSIEELAIAYRRAERAFTAVVISADYVRLSKSQQEEMRRPTYNAFVIAEIALRVACDAEIALDDAADAEIGKAAE